VYRAPLYFCGVQFRFMRFQCFTTGNMNMTDLWDKAPCSLVGVDRCFRGIYCFHHQGDSCLILQDCTAPCTRRLSYSHFFVLLYIHHLHSSFLYRLHSFISFPPSSRIPFSMLLFVRPINTSFPICFFIYPFSISISTPKHAVTE
jgi:hypothetical protein